MEKSLVHPCPIKSPLTEASTGEEEEGEGKNLDRFAQSSAEMAEWVSWVGDEETVRTPSGRKVWARYKEKPGQRPWREMEGGRGAHGGAEPKGLVG